ncbi:TldD/PmbA family protein [Candidatus Micrarchaeota archaeon]|nr:TldD/PmbA family protein [Candidatus Micrarchaeota archaeon]
MEYEKILSKYLYAELRLEKTHETYIRISDGEIKQSIGQIQGISVRVLENGAWGFASSSSTLDRGKVETLLKKAQKLAKLKKGKVRIETPEKESAKVDDKVGSVGFEEQVKTLEGFRKEMENSKIKSRENNKIKSTIISSTDSKIIKEFYNSEGSYIEQKIGYSYVSATAIAKSGENIQRGSERSWSRSGFGDIDLEIGEKAAEKAVRLLGAKSPPKGRFTVVFDPEMTGVFSHEAVGHACEADSIVEKESILAGKLGKKIGSELVSITDDPLAENFGNYKYDEEGVKASKAVLVEDGILKGFMNSRETACELNHKNNGHARSESYSSIPVVRMSNTYFSRGKSSMDDIFDMRNGIYLIGMKGGSVDIFSGGFMFKAEEAYKIKNGERAELMRDVTITGNVLETMLNVEAVGKDFGTSPGMCGKFGQDAPVSDGGPHIRVKNLTIG